MNALLVVRFVHLVAAATWVGGIIVLAPIVLTLRREGADRALIVAAARTFARVTWVAFAIAVGTGLMQAHWMGFFIAGYRPVWIKIAAVALSALIVLIHQRTAARVTPALRGTMELAVLISSLLVVAAAVAI